MARPTRRTVRRLARRAAFAAIPMLVLLGLAEALARVFPPPAVQTVEHEVLLSPHATRIWGLTPGRFLEAGIYVDIDDDGLRRVGRTGAPWTVLTLGDSSIYGYGLPDDGTLHASLRRALADQGVEADVICGAVPGYSTEQSLRLMADVGWALEPDLLLIGNLWSDTNSDHFQDRAWLDALDSGPQHVERGLARSAAWRWLRRALTPEAAWYLPVGWIRDPTLVGHRRVPLDDYRANLVRLVSEGAERGAHALILQPANRIRLADLERPTPATHGWDPWFEAQRELAAELDVPIVDARDVLQVAGLTVDEAFLDDMHPTARSNAAYAARLVQEIKARGWLESPPPPVSGSAQGDPPDPHNTGGSPP